jgi:hypothetical protein
LDPPARNNEDGESKLDLVTDESDPAASIDLGALAARERGIIESRAAGKTLDEIGTGVGVSRERVRQLNDRAVEKARTTKGNIARACIRDLISRRGYRKPSRQLLPFKAVKYSCRSFSKAEIEAYERGEL